MMIALFKKEENLDFLLTITNAASDDTIRTKNDPPTVAIILFRKLEGILAVRNTSA